MSHNLTKERKKDKNLITIICITMFLTVVILFAAYMGLASYYKGGFSYGTWINGIYCTGKTVDEVNKELLKSYTYEGLTVYNKEDYSYEIKSEDVDFSFDFKAALDIYLKKQNPYLWIDNLFVSKSRQLVPIIDYDKNKFSQILDSIPFLADEAENSDREVYITKSYAGYELINERSDVLNIEKAKTEIEQSFIQTQKELHLSDRQCYEDLPLTDKMQEDLALWDKINEFQNCRIIYKFGEEQVPINASVVCDWITTLEDGSFVYDEEGQLITDEKKIKEFIDRLADEYDTVGGTRYFKATRGDIVAVSGGIYGNKVDRKAETAYLIQAFYEKGKEIHEPMYTQKGWVQGKNDIGHTYIEIDMTEQKMYYYKDGKKELETSIVTGNTGRRMGTPEGVNYVYGKQENRILRGPNYASHVNFWMPVKGNIGIHDASWRSEYGEEIYKTSGSHGCINTPYDKMKELYGMADIGTPVVMFY